VHLLVVVEEAVAARGGGTQVFPRFTLDKPSRGTLAVLLRLPNGQERRTRATLDVAHIRGPMPPFALVRLIDDAPESVPTGTEIFRVDDDA